MGVFVAFKKHIICHHIRIFSEKNCYLSNEMKWSKRKEKRIQDFQQTDEYTLIYYLCTFIFFCFFCLIKDENHLNASKEKIKLEKLKIKKGKKAKLLNFQMNCRCFSCNANCFHLNLCKKEKYINKDRDVYGCGYV